MDMPETAGAEHSIPGEDPKSWIVFLSPDRRVLWANACDGPLGANSALGARAGRDTPPSGFLDWNDLLEIARKTRAPQTGCRRIAVGGTERDYTIEVFPDFGLDGEFKGIVLAAEPGDRRDGTGLRKSVDALFGSALAGVILYDPPGDRILNVNRGVIRQTGRSLAELENAPGKTLFGEKGAALLRHVFSRMTAPGKSMVWGQILAIEDHYGRRRDCFCSLRPVPRHPGPDSPPAMLITFDEQPAPASGGDPNARFVAEMLLDGLWEYDTHERTFRYGASFAGIVGPEGAPGGPGKKLEDWLEMVHPAESNLIFRGWRNLIGKGVRYQIEYRIRDEKGDWHWIHSVIAAIINDVRGRPRKVIGFHQDISDAIHTRRNTMEAEERLRAIFENIGSGIAVAGLDGRILQVNPALALLLGRECEDFIGHRLSDLAHPDDRESMLDILGRIIRHGQRETMDDIRLLRADGDVRWVNLNATMSGRVFGGDRYLILMFDDVTASHAHRMRMQYEATHDVMTGAWNRWFLLERLEQHLRLALRHRSPMVFCICDLDYFKKINDMYGHLVGDNVLVEFVRALKESVRETDIVGRYGGDEFGIVFPQTTPEEARQAVERARVMLGEMRFRAASGEAFGVTATFGLAGAVPDSTAKTLIDQADTALYAGKKNGRDRSMIFSSSMPADSYSMPGMDGD